jgi:hypothetical protein
MYDLVDGNDCQIYIRRNTGIRTRFNIVCTKTAANMTNDNFAKDSDGYSGQSLFSDIHEEAHIINSYKFPRQITSYNPFFEFAESSLTHGVANDIVVNENQFIGSMYKVGNYYKDNGYEYLVGGNYINNKLTTAHRNADNTDYEFNTYTAKEENAYIDTKEQLDAYGSGHPLFYQPQRKIITRYGSTYYDALGNVVGNTSSDEIKNVAISYKDLADKPNIETDEADDVFYIADKDGNVIATIDSQGLCSTKVNAKEIVLNTTNGEKKVLSTEDFTVSDGVLTFNFL